MDERVLRVTRGAAIAALYAVVTIIFQPISYGLVQVRISEALTLLPFLWIEAVPGVFIGCLLANIWGGSGLLDIILGSAATLAAAILTRYAPNKFLAAAPPVLVNALVVGVYLSYLLNAPMFLSIFYVGCGQAIACYALGLPLLNFVISGKMFVNK